MQKKILCVFMCIVVLTFATGAFVACNSNELPSTFEMPEGSRPDQASLFSAEDTSKLNAALSAGATQEQKKEAVMILYSTANASRINTPLSLVVQESDAGISMGSVLMHSFNLRNGDKWYYQLATSVKTDSPFFDAILAATAGYLKVGYSKGDGNYYYFGKLGPQFKCDCSIPTFPYATFVIPVDENAKPEDKPFANAMTLQEFNSTLNVLNSIHEINNMNFCKEIIADDPIITYENGVYKVAFAVDTVNSDQALLEKWYAMPQKDMQVGGQNINKYNSYTAVLEVWDNGYAKYFESHADRDAGLASGKPVDKYTYIWEKSDIMTLLKQDQSVDDKSSLVLRDVEDYIDYYSDPDFVAKELGALEKTAIVIAAIVAAIIIIVVTIEVLVKKGKLPKLAAHRAKKKEKRLQRKQARKNKKLGLPADYKPEDVSDGAQEIANDDAECEKPDFPIDVAFGYPPESDEQSDDLKNGAEDEEK